MRELGHCAPDETEPTVMFPFILADARCRFLATVPLGATVRVHLRSPSVGTKSFGFEYLVTDGDRPVAVGHSTQVLYDYAAGRTQPVPDHFLALLQRREGKELR